jgi:hypothetical protein
LRIGDRACTGEEDEEGNQPSGGWRACRFHVSSRELANKRTSRVLEKDTRSVKPDHERHSMAKRNVKMRLGLVPAESADFAGPMVMGILPNRFAFHELFNDSATR